MASHEVPITGLGSAQRRATGLRPLSQDPITIPRIILSGEPSPLIMIGSSFTANLGKAETLVKRHRIQHGGIAGE